MNHLASFRSLLTILCIISFSLFYVGCGGSEETMAEDEMITDTGAEEATTEDEGVTEEEGATEEEGITEEEGVTEENAIVEEEQAPEQAQQEEQQPEAVDQQQPVQQIEGPSRDQLQVDLDNLKTENIQLKEQLASTEQSNRELTAKVSDLEAANAAMKEQPSQSRGTRTAITPYSAAAGKSSPQEIQVYEAAVARFNSKNYSDAISELQTLLNSGIKDDYADNCHYWMGVSYFQTKDYSNALQHFQQVMGYRYSEKKDDAQIMIAQCYDRQGEKEQAQSEYRKLIEMYPTSEYVSRARSRVR